MELSDKEKHILLHTLGYDNAKEPYRNRYITCSNTEDFNHLLNLETKGLMIRSDIHKVYFSPEEQICFYATIKGEKLAAEIKKQQKVKK